MCVILKRHNWIKKMRITLRKTVKRYATFYLRNDYKKNAKNKNST